MPQLLSTDASSSAQNERADSLMTPAQAAQWLHCSLRTLWALTAPRGAIPVARMNRLLRYDLQDLKRYIEQAKLAPPAKRAPRPAKAEAAGVK